MPFFLQLYRNRQVRLAAVVVVLLLAAGLGLLPFRAAAALAAPAGTPPAEIAAAVDEAVIRAAVKTGYWAMLAALALFVRAAWQVARAGWHRRPPGRTEAGALALVLACGGVLLAHEQHGFKTLADEVLLLGTSMGMHLDRDAAYPQRAHDIQGPFQLAGSVLDKRPFFFPFVVTLVHDLTGYRADNPFWVNTALGFVFLSLIWLLGRDVGGSPWAGHVGVLLFTGLPLLAQQMAGGGMDLLNLTLLAALLLLARELAERPGPGSQEALVFGAVLLASTRYESALYLAPVALLLVWAWWREGRVALSWPAAAAPLLLLPALWQHHLFTINPAAWELPPGVTVPFALANVPGQLGHALNFLFDLSGYQPGSPVFGALGLLALPVLVLWSARALRAPRAAAPGDFALALMAAALLAAAALLMAYYLGIDQHLVHRLALPLHLLFALAVVVVGGHWFRGARGWQTLAAAVLLALVTQGLPVMAQRAYETDYLPAAEMAWRREFLRRYPERDYFFIDRDSVFWIVNQVAATTPLEARLRRNTELAFHLRNHSYSDIFVFQRHNVQPGTGALVLDPADDLGPGYELEPVWERRIATMHLDRISRLTALQTADGAILRQTHLAAPAAGPPRTSEELEKAREDYVKQWIQKLP